MIRIKSGGYIGPYMPLMLSAQVELVRSLLHDEPLDWSVIDPGPEFPNDEGVL